MTQPMKECDDCGFSYVDYCPTCMNPSKHHITQPNLIETIVKALEQNSDGAYEYVEENHRSWLRALLEENKRMREYVNTTNYNSEKIAMDHTRLEIELSDKDKVLEWYSNLAMGGIRAQSILSKYRRTTDEK